MKWHSDMTCWILALNDDSWFWILISSLVAILIMHVFAHFITFFCVMLWNVIDCVITKRSLRDIRLLKLLVCFCKFNQLIRGFWNYDITLPVKMFGPFWSVRCKMALAEVGGSLPWCCPALVLLAPGYWSLFLNLIIFSWNPS